MTLKSYIIVDDNGHMVNNILIDDEDKQINDHYISFSWSHQDPRGWFNPKWDFANKKWIDDVDSSILLDNKKDSKNQELNEACKQAILSGFDQDINGVSYHFSYDAEAQQNFSDGNSALKDGLVTSITWTVTNNSTGLKERIDVDSTLMRTLTIAILNHKGGNISKYRDTLMPKVNSATTIDEVNAITWDMQL